MLLLNVKYIDGIRIFKFTNKSHVRIMNPHLKIVYYYHARQHRGAIEFNWTTTIPSKIFEHNSINKIFSEVVKLESLGKLVESSQTPQEFT